MVRGPDGGGFVAARGPGRRRGLARLPDGCRNVHHGGSDYWYDGEDYYRPYYQGDDIYYQEVDPPVGVYYDTVPEDTSVAVGGDTYYYYNDVYLSATEKDGKKVYEVVAPPAGAPEPEAASDSSVPDPFDVLKTMTDYLTKVNQFTVNAGVTHDEIQESGQKIQVSSSRTVCLSRPNRMAVERRSAKEIRHVVYDGKAVTVVSRTRLMYAVIKAPETLEAAYDMLARDYGMTIALSDLVLPNAYKGLTEPVQTGQYLGLHQVAAYQCHHLAFTQDDVDWQIWIQDGEQPLPRKLLITYKQLPGSPRYVLTARRWDLTGPPNNMLDVRIPEGAKKIEVLPISARKGGPAVKAGS